MRRTIVLSLAFAVATAVYAADPYPHACVDCHVNKGGKDLRVSTLAKNWSDAKLLARLQPLAPKGVTLKGKHPPLAAFVKDMPKKCMACHAATSKTAPPLARMMHVLHLAGGPAKAQCVDCHKLTATGAQPVPSGAEK